jgi:hypothetical protein
MTLVNLPPSPSSTLLLYLFILKPAFIPWHSFVLVKLFAKTISFLKIKGKAVVIWIWHVPTGSCFQCLVPTGGAILRGSGYFWRWDLSGGSGPLGLLSLVPFLSLSPSASSLPWCELLHRAFLSMMNWRNCKPK